MQSKYIAALAATVGIFASANAQFQSAQIVERFWNDFPGSTLVTTNNYPTLIRFDESNSTLGNYANQHRWLFSSDGGATPSPFGTSDYFQMELNYSVDSNHPEIAKRKEGGIICDGPSGDGKFMVASDGEIAVFGGAFTFYKFTKTYTPGTTVKMVFRYYKSGVDNFQRFWVTDSNGTEDTGGMYFSNLEGGIPNGTFFGGFAQPQLGGGLLQTADYKWSNIRAFRLFPDKLSGKVTLGDYIGDVTAPLVTIEIRRAGTATVLKTETVNLDAEGNYQTSIVGLNGMVDVAVKGSHWLQKLVTNIELDSTGTGGVDAALVNGDIDGDNSVTVFDYNALSDAFDSSPGDANWNANADLDGDGSVTVFDYNVLSANFDLNGDA